MSRRDFFQLFCMFYLRLINRKCAKEKKQQYLMLYQTWNRTSVYFRQTWNLSKILHRRIFRLKILHRQFHLILTVLVRKNTKNEWKWRNLHRWQKFYTAAGSDGMDKFHLCAICIMFWGEGFAIARHGMQIMIIL